MAKSDRGGKGDNTVESSMLLLKCCISSYRHHQRDPQCSTTLVTSTSFMPTIMVVTQWLMVVEVVEGAAEAVEVEWVAADLEVVAAAAVLEVVAGKFFNLVMYLNGHK